MASSSAAIPRSIQVTSLCAKCGGHYNDPRLLSCFHVFCMSCLVAENNVTRCPICCAVSPQLPHLLPRHVHLSKVSSFDSLAQPDQSCGSCEKKTEQLVMYCYQCESGVCSSCVLA